MSGWVESQRCHAARHSCHRSMLITLASLPWLGGLKTLAVPTISLKGGSDLDLGRPFG